MQNLIKIFFYLSMFLIPAFADDPTFIVKVPSPDAVEIMWTVLNAIAGIFQSSDYTDLLRMLFLFGSFIVFATMALNTDGSSNGFIKYVKYNIIVVTLLSVMFSSTKGSIIVESENLSTYVYDCTKYNPSLATNNPSSGTVVGNVPYVLAYTYATMSQLGTFTTKIMEQAFWPPSMRTVGTSAMLDVGYVGGLRSVIDLLSITPNSSNNPTLGFALKTFVYQCLIEPFSNKTEGEIYLNQLYTSKNIFQDLKTWFISSPITISTSSGASIPITNLPMQYYGSSYPCGYFFQEKILGDYNMSAMGQQSLCAINMQKPGGTMFVLDPSLSGNVVASLEDTAIQAGLVNTLLEASNQAGLGIATGSPTSYAIGKTKADLTFQGIGSGYYMSKMLPILQMLFRGIIYGVVPFIFAVSLLPGGLQILVQYLKSVVWIELWGPTAAILNYFIIAFTSTQVSRTFGSEGVTPATAALMITDTATYAGIAGYMYASVPAISWMLITGSAVMLGNFSEGISQRFSQNFNTRSMAEDSKKLGMKDGYKTAGGDEKTVDQMQVEAARFAGLAEGTATQTQKIIGEAALISSTRDATFKKNADAFTKENGITKALNEAYKIDMDIAKNSGEIVGYKGKENAIAMAGLSGEINASKISGEIEGTSIVAKEKDKSIGDFVKDISKESKKIEIGKQIGEIKAYSDNSDSTTKLSEDISNFESEKRIFEYKANKENLGENAAKRIGESSATNTGIDVKTNEGFDKDGFSINKRAEGNIYAKEMELLTQKVEKDLLGGKNNALNKISEARGYQSYDTVSKLNAVKKAVNKNPEIYESVKHYFDTNNTKEALDKAAKLSYSLDVIKNDFYQYKNDEAAKLGFAPISRELTDQIFDSKTADQKMEYLRKRSAELNSFIKKEVSGIRIDTSKSDNEKGFISMNKDVGGKIIGNVDITSAERNNMEKTTEVLSAIEGGRQMLDRYQKTVTSVIPAKGGKSVKGGKSEQKVPTSDKI